MIKPLTHIRWEKALQPEEQTHLKIEEDLSSILARCMVKDRKYEKQLYERFYNFVLAICLRYAQDKREAKSFANLAFLKMFTSLHQFRKEGVFESWLGRLTVHSCIDQIRSRVSNQVQSEIIKQVAFVDSCVLDKLMLDDIYKIIQTLPTTHQTVFSLYVIDGFKHQEIATILNISIGTSRWYLSKAKQLLKEKLNRY